MLDEHARHGFTHFNLDCTLAAATIGEHSDAVEGEWWPIADLEFGGAADGIRQGGAEFRENAMRGAVHGAELA